jgi:hypothetical protein
VHRGLLQTGAWLLATAVAVTLSWFGVKSVLRSTAYDPPRALPITGTTLPSLTSSTHRPKPATAPPTTAGTRPPETTPPPTTPPPSTAAIPPQTPPGTPKATTSASAPTSDTVHSYSVPGGRVVLSLTATAASLVSATPDDGWQMQVWTQTGWLRVTFTSADGTGSSSVFCTWNGHPPTVETYEE